VSAFEDFVKDVLMRTEGGYSDDPDDRGGATDFGVTQSTYDDYRDHHKLPRQPVKLINELEAWDVYKHFWSMGANALEEWPSMAIQYFDACINCGPGNAARLLQQALGLTDDGIFGPYTLRIATTSLRRAERWWSENFAVKRIKYYVDLKNQKFEDGWLVRTVRVAAYALARVATK